MRTLIAAIMLVTAAQASQPNVEFDPKDEPSIRGVPEEASLQAEKSPKSHGTLARLIGDSIQSFKVLYASRDWTEKQLREYLAGLVTDDSTAIYTCQIWSQRVLDPEVECSITFKDQKQGKLLLWQTCACVQDSRGKWWFVSVFDYFHKHHPRGNRSTVRAP